MTEIGGARNDDGTFVLTNGMVKVVVRESLYEGKNT